MAEQRETVKKPILKPRKKVDKTSQGKNDYD